MTQENTPSASADSAGQGEGCMFSGFMARMMERYCGGATCGRMIAECARGIEEKASKPSEG